jgi:uncharacterized membrane-anchored protein
MNPELSPSSAAEVGSGWSTFDKAFLFAALLNCIERGAWLLGSEAHGSGLIQFGVAPLLIVTGFVTYALALFDVFARYPRGDRAGWIVTLLVLNVAGVILYWIWQRARSLRRHSRRS